MVDVNVLVQHDLLGEFLNNRRRRQARAHRVQHIGAVPGGKAFGHLAAARIANAQK